MTRFIRVAVNAVALLLAGLLVPGIEIAWGDDALGIALTLVALAIVFGLVNASIGSLARILSVPLNILTLGLFSVLLNAALLLLVALVVDLLWRPVIVIGGFPPELGLQALASAAAGALLIGVVSTVLNLLIPGS
jgi:putative membrane protein